MTAVKNGPIVDKDHCFHRQSELSYEGNTTSACRNAVKLPDDNQMQSKFKGFSHGKLDHLTVCCDCAYVLVRIFGDTIRTQSIVDCICVRFFVNTSYVLHAADSKQCTALTISKVTSVKAALVALSLMTSLVS